MNNHLVKLSLTIPLLMPTLCFAEDSNAIDPGDKTKVYTYLGANIDSDSNVKLLGSVSGGYSNGDNFLLYGEAVLGDADFDDEDYGTAYQNSRLQYFHVMKTGWNSFPKLGFSIDALHSELAEIPSLDSEMAIASAGVVGMINPKYTSNFMVFPNVGYAAGKLYGDDVDGLIANLFITRPISSNRAYVGFFPEYLDLEGDYVKHSQMKFKFQVGTPITDSGKLWLTATFTHQETKSSMFGSESDWENTSLVDFGFKYYI